MEVSYKYTVTTANTDVKMFTIPVGKIFKVKYVVISNPSTTSSATIVIKDGFTPLGGSATKLDKFVIIAGTSSNVLIDLKGVKLIGDVYVNSSLINVNITIGGELIG